MSDSVRGRKINMFCHVIHDKRNNTYKIMCDLNKHKWTDITCGKVTGRRVGNGVNTTISTVKIIPENKKKAVAEINVSRVCTWRTKYGFITLTIVVEAYIVRQHQQHLINIIKWIEQLLAKNRNKTLLEYLKVTS